jgi:uncharacterized protein YegL
MAKKKKYITNKKKTQPKQPNTNEKTHIVCVLDSSGSMASTIDEARTGFNEYIDKQRNLNDRDLITVALFDSHTNYELLHNNANLSKIKKITEQDWYPRGMTALYDAIGKTASSVKRNHEKMSKKDRPNKVLFIIVTDGHENDSKEYKHDAIKTLITDLEENNNWKFVYLGADPNENAVEIGTSFGISAGNTLQFTNSAVGTSNMYGVLDSATTSYRGMSASNLTLSNSSADTLLIDANDGSNELKDD